jgi:hypothetical protein
MELRPFVFVGAGLVGIATAATSAVSLYNLAARCGIPEPLSAALPVALDVGAAVAALVWVTQEGKAREWGIGIALSALIATVAGNGIEHAISTGFLELTLWLVITVGSCIPAMLFATIHLLALMATEQPRDEETEQPEPNAGISGKSYAPLTLVHEGSGKMTNSEPITFTAPDVSFDIRPGVTTVSEHADRVQWARDNWPVTAKEISEKFSVSMATAYRVRKEANGKPQ